MRPVLLSCCVVLPGAWLFAPAAEPNEKPAAVDYQRDVAPILEAKCNRCHSAKKADGKLMTTSPDAMLKGGTSGPAIVAGKPDKSILIELIHHNEMPPKRTQPRVTADELKTLKAWIAAMK